MIKKNSKFISFFEKKGEMFFQISIDPAQGHVIEGPPKIFLVFLTTLESTGQHLLKTTQYWKEVHFEIIGKWAKNKA